MRLHCNAVSPIYLLVPKIEGMPKRVTILLDEDLDKKIRSKQAKLIQKTNESVSFSHVINELLKTGLK